MEVKTEHGSFGGIPNLAHGCNRVRESTETDRRLWWPIKQDLKRLRRRRMHAEQRRKDDDNTRVNGEEVMIPL
jgi:hypothetical protein